MQPTIGGSAGGTLVLVRGTNFLNGETAVSFGGIAGTNVTWIDSTTLRVTTPAHPSGSVDVRVETPGGSATQSSAYLYRDPPVILSFTPGAGLGGTAVTIIGQHFDPNASGNVVTFAGVAAQVVSASATQLVVTAPQNVQTGPIVVTTNGGTGTSSTNFLAVTTSAIVVSPTSATVQIGQTTQVTASATLSNGGTLDVTAHAVWSSTNETVATVSSGGVVEGRYRGKAAITASLSNVSGSAALSVKADETIPPDPVAVAPQPDPAATVVSLADSVSFLYSGQTPVQRGVEPGTIQARQGSVVRGRVLSPAGGPLSGVFVAIHDQPELGYTITRADGRFDLVVNGGGPVIIEYDKDGYLPAQRRLETSWGSWSDVPEVMLVAVDPKVTTISLTTPAAMQTAQATRVVDDDGARTATILFPAGTTASLRFADGTTQPLNTLSVRATEYTVGPNGPKSMPAALPPASAYTYAVELSVDEAITMGATEVKFNQPLPFYLDNFLDFPVGSTVPAGYYVARPTSGSRPMTASC